MDTNNTSKKQMHTVTILDVANESGVSCATVSRVLNGYEFVKESTRQRVMEAVDRLGYSVNLHARTLAGGRSQIIGLLVPNLDNNYVGAIAKGIDQELERINYDLLLYTTHRQRNKESTYINALTNGLTAGLILVAPLVPAGYLVALREQDIPYVLIDQADTDGQSTVVESTNWQGAYDATCYLNRLGHQRIACITGLMDVNSAVERLAGYKAALADCNLPFHEELVIEGYFWQEGGYEATKTLLQNVNPLPTAIFAANDLSAIGAMDAINEFGLSIPDDISVIGFDDIPLAASVEPRLTTVRQPLEQMGRVAVKLLLEQLERQKRSSRRIALATQLVIRDSCGAPKTK